MTNLLTLNQASAELGTTQDVTNVHAANDQLSVATTPLFDGSYAFKWVTDGAFAFQAIEWRVNVAGQFIAGAQYTISAYVYSPLAGVTGRFYMQANTGSIGGSPAVTLAQGWQRLTQTVTLPNPITQSYFAIRFDTGGTAHAMTAYFDALQFEAGAAASAYAAPVTPPSLVAGSAIVVAPSGSSTLVVVPAGSSTLTVVPSASSATL